VSVPARSRFVVPRRPTTGIVTGSVLWRRRRPLGVELIDRDVVLEQYSSRVAAAVRLSKSSAATAVDVRLFSSLSRAVAVQRSCSLATVFLENGLNASVELR